MNYVKNSLTEKSEIYYERADIYERLCQAEDFDGKVMEFLAPRLSGLRVLDVGCGSGKYVKLLAPVAKSITGLDAAPGQLEIARGKTKGLANVELFLGDAADAALHGVPFGAAIACWMLGTIAGEKKRQEVVSRVLDSLSPGGVFYLVENDSRGEFEQMRGRVASSQSYNLWLQESAGFVYERSLASKFQFESQAEASSVIGSIWGGDVGAKASGPCVEHCIAVFSKRRADL